MKNKIYMDNNSTTQLHPFLINKMEKYYLKYYANPSASHSMGIKAKKGLEESRKIIANELNCNPEEIIFTSGATESNNMMLRGFMNAHPDKNHIITSDIEHASIYQTCKDLIEKYKYKISYIPVDNNGIIDINKLTKAINKKTALITVMLANNEIGTIQPIKEIAKIAKKHKIPFHTDGTQYIGKWKFDVKKYNIDALSASSHKFHGPNGTGFIFIKNGLKIKKCMTGGLSKEQFMRSSTPDVPCIVGMAQAMKYNLDESRYLKNYNHVKEMTNFIKNEIKKNFDKVIINGSEKHCMINTLSVSFPNINDSREFMLLLDKKGLIVNTGSACSAHKKSRILEHIKLPDNYINGTIRISLSCYNKMSECKKLINVLKDILKN